MSLSFDEIRTFIEVARCGQFSAAARSLGVTQPALSTSMRKLEERLGATLFLRLPRGIKLTRAGELLEVRSRAMLREWEQILGALRDDAQSVQGLYSIGVNPTLAAHTLPRFLPGLLEAWPKLEVKLMHDVSRNVAQAVVDLRCDLGIVVNPPRHPDLTVIKLYNDEISFWRPTKGKWKVGAANVPVLCHPDVLSTEPMLNDLVRLARFDGIRVVYANDLHVIARLCAAGCGIGLLPHSVANLAQVEEKVSLVPIEDSPRRRDSIALIWRGDAQSSLASKVIRDQIVAALKR
jgi:DNA-binding transcriptional LysR family regulator